MFIKVMLTIAFLDVVIMENIFFSFLGVFPVCTARKVKKKTTTTKTPKLLFSKSAKLNIEEVQACQHRQMRQKLQGG